MSIDPPLQLTQEERYSTLPTLGRTQATLCMAKPPPKHPQMLGKRPALENLPPAS